MDEEKIKEKIRLAYKISEESRTPYKEKVFEIILKYLLDSSTEYNLKKEEILEEVKNEIVGEDMPQLSARGGCRPAIIELLNTPWGRKTPRTVSEIREVLKLNAMFFPSSTIPATLTQLTRAGKVRRIIQGGVLSYVIRD